MTTPHEFASGLALGLDIGGTSTRALVIDRDGHRLGSGRAEGANITSHAAEHALRQIRAAVEAAVSSIDAASVAVALIGTAGPANLRTPANAAELDGIWTSAGLQCGYTVTADAPVAFASGTPSPNGTLILAGTGAITARVVDHEVRQAADGHGWLLGDLGSAFHIGREAVRTTLRVLDEERTPGPVARAVLAKLVGDADAPISRDTLDELVLRVHAQPPVALADLAPLVSDLYEDDEDAVRIVSDAAGLLIDTARRVRTDDDTTPIVLGGGLLIGDTPVADIVRRRVSQTWPDAEIGYARDGAAGAAWLAATSMGPLPATARATLFPPE